MQRINLDLSGAGSAGIQQYIDRVCKVVALNYECRLLGVTGSKFNRTLNSILSSWRYPADYFWATAPSFAITFSRARNKKIVTVHDMRSYLDTKGDHRAVVIYRRVSLRLSMHSADVIICVSRRTRDDIAQIFPKFLEKCAVVPLSGEREIANSPTISKGKGKSVVVIAHEHNKQARKVLPAIPLLDSEYTFTFLAGRHKADWHSEVATIKNARLKGFVSDTEYLTILAESSAVIMLSNFEGFGLPIVEAQRMSIPVVISGDRALLEVASPDACVVFDVDSPAEIARSIIQATSISGQKLSLGAYDLRNWADVVSDTSQLF